MFVVSKIGGGFKVISQRWWMQREHKEHFKYEEEGINFADKIKKATQKKEWFEVR